MTLDEHLGSIYQAKTAGKPTEALMNAFVSHLKLDPDLLTAAKTKWAALRSIALEKCFISSKQAELLAEALSQL